MAEQPGIDYGAVLADLETRRAQAVQAVAQFDAAIASVRSIIGGVAHSIEGAAAPALMETAIIAPVPVASVNGFGPARNGKVHIESDTFFGITTAQAIKKYLTLAKRPQTPKAMAEVLHDGGQVHAVDVHTAYRNVYTALMRLAKSQPPQVVQTRKGDWGLAEWYKTESTTQKEKVQKALDDS